MPRNDKSGSRFPKWRALRPRTESHGGSIRYENLDLDFKEALQIKKILAKILLASDDTLNLPATGNRFNNTSIDRWTQEMPVRHFFLWCGTVALSKPTDLGHTDWIVRKAESKKMLAQLLGLETTPEDAKILEAIEIAFTEASKHNLQRALGKEVSGSHPSL